MNAIFRLLNKGAGMQLVTDSKKHPYWRLKFELGQVLVFLFNCAVISFYNFIFLNTPSLIMRAFCTVAVYTYTAAVAMLIASVILEARHG